MKLKGLYALSGVKISQITKIMRLFTICMFVFGASANCFSQKHTVTLDLYQCDVSTLFQEIWKQTGLRFVYNDRDVAKVARFDLQVKDKAVEEVLKDVFHETTLRCTFDGDVIMVIASKQQAVAADTVKKVTVKGKVTD